MHLGVYSENVAAEVVDQSWAMIIGSANSRLVSGTVAAMTRAHLILNPEARGVTPALTRVVRSALEAHFKMETTLTAGREDAIAVAATAAAEGVELVIAFGGDGLVNEVVNGLVGHDSTLAIIPGGTMNVFARNIGLPNDVVGAVDAIIRRYSRSISVRLGKAGDRYFTFACGCGFDADAAERVESHKTSKRRFGETYFYAAAFSTFIRSYFSREPYLLCEGEFGASEGVLAIATIAGPYAYLMGRPIRLVAEGSPEDDALDLFVLRKLRYSHLTRYASGAMLTGEFGPESARHSLKGSYTVSSAHPFGVHVDGEPLPHVSEISIGLSDESISVVN